MKHIFIYLAQWENNHRTSGPCSETTLLLDLSKCGMVSAQWRNIPYYQNINNSGPRDVSRPCNCQRTHSMAGHSPGPSVCDYFLWSYFKFECTFINLGDINKFRATIQEITVIQSNMVQATMQNLHMMTNDACAWQMWKTFDICAI